MTEYDEYPMEWPDSAVRAVEERSELIESQAAKIVNQTIEINELRARIADLEARLAQVTRERDAADGISRKWTSVIGRLVSEREAGDRERDRARSARDRMRHRLDECYRKRSQDLQRLAAAEESERQLSQLAIGIQTHLATLARERDEARAQLAGLAASRHPAEIDALRDRIAAYEAEPLAGYAFLDPRGAAGLVPCYLHFGIGGVTRDRLEWERQNNPDAWCDCRIVALHARELPEVGS